MQPESLSAIAAMITGFNASSIDADTQLNAYAIAAHGNRPDAIQSAAARFIRGEVEAHKRKDRCPTVAEFATECRSEHSRIVANENRRHRRITAQPQAEQTIEHRMKMGALLKTLNRALNGEREAQEYLDEWLAKRGAVNHGWGRGRRA